MSLTRSIAAAFLAAGITVAAVSAQQGLPPGVKVPPQIKPGNPVPPKVNPNPPKQPPVVDPKLPIPMPPGTGLPPGVIIPPGGIMPPSGGPAVMPKKDETKWPEKINGKSLDATVKDIRGQTDPAIREAAIRALPGFGPKSRDLGGASLYEAMTKDGDWNVRIAAMEVTPQVMLGYAKAPDAALSMSMTYIGDMISSQNIQYRVPAIAISTAVGPYMRTAYPKVVKSLTNQANQPNPWQVRRTAVAAIGAVGQGVQIGEAPTDKAPPDVAAVAALLDILRNDNCAAVRREAVDSLIGVGPVDGVQQKAWRAGLDNTIKTEKDKSVVLWTRVCIILNDPSGLKGNETHLSEIALVLQAPEPGGRLEACQALEALGEEGVTKLQGVIDIVQQPKEENAVVIAAIAAIAAVPSKDNLTVPILTKIKDTHANADVREAAKVAVEYLQGRKKKA